MVLKVMECRPPTSARFMSGRGVVLGCIALTSLYGCSLHWAAIDRGVSRKSEAPLGSGSGAFQPIEPVQDSLDLVGTVWQWVAAQLLAHGVGDKSPVRTSNDGGQRLGGVVGAGGVGEQGDVGVPASGHGDVDVVRVVPGSRTAMPMSTVSPWLP